MICKVKDNGIPDSEKVRERKDEASTNHVETRRMCVMVAGRASRLLDEVCWDRWLKECVFALQMVSDWGWSDDLTTTASHVEWWRILVIEGTSLEKGTVRISIGMSRRCRRNRGIIRRGSGGCSSSFMEGTL